MRALHKVWQNKRSGWTRRVRWYQNADASSIRLQFTDERGLRNVFYYKDVSGAQRDWQAFIDGASALNISNDQELGK